MPGHGKEYMMFFWKRNESPEAKLKKADEHYKGGVAYLQTGQFDKAEKELRSCLSILEPLTQQHESRTLQRKLSQTYSMLCVRGLAVADEKKRSEAVTWAKKAIAIDEKLVEEGGTADAYDALATSYSNLGAATMNIQLCDKALQIWMKLQEQYPNNRLYAKRVEDQQYNNRQLLLKLLK